MSGIFTSLHEIPNVQRNVHAHTLRKINVFLSRDLYQLETHDVQVICEVR